MKSKILNVTAFLGCVKIVNGKQLMLTTDRGYALELIIPDNIAETIGLAMDQPVSLLPVFEDDSVVD